MSEAKNTEVKGAQASAPVASPQGGENSQTNTSAAEAAQDGANPPSAAAPATDSTKAVKKSKGKSGKFLVISPFADRDNFGKMWNEGDDVSHFDEDRRDLCVSRGLVKEA